MDVTEALALTSKLLTMSRLELEVAYDMTDNPKFKEIISSVIQSRFKRMPVGNDNGMKLTKVFVDEA